MDLSYQASPRVRIHRGWVCFVYQSTSLRDFDAQAVAYVMSGMYGSLREIGRLGASGSSGQCWAMVKNAVRMKGVRIWWGVNGNILDHLTTILVPYNILHIYIYIYIYILYTHIQGYKNHPLDICIPRMTILQLMHVCIYIYIGI